MGASGKIFLVDDCARRRAEVTYGLRDTDIHVEPFSSADDLLAHQGGHDEDAVVLIRDNEHDLVKFVSGMHSAGKWYAYIGFSPEPPIANVVAALSGGAIGYLQFPFEPTELVTMIKSNADRIMRQRRAAEARRKIRRLTSREREVLQGVAEGQSNRKIADALSISARTVEIHRANLLRKIDASHTFGAIRTAIEAEHL